MQFLSCLLVCIWRLSICPIGHLYSMLCFEALDSLMVLDSSFVNYLRVTNGQDASHHKYQGINSPEIAQIYPAISLVGISSAVLISTSLLFTEVIDYINGVPGSAFQFIVMPSRKGSKA